MRKRQRQLRRRPELKGDPNLGSALLSKLVGIPDKKLGVQLIRIPAGIQRDGQNLSHRTSDTWMLRDGGDVQRFSSKHDAVKYWLTKNPNLRTYGHFSLIHSKAGWHLRSLSSQQAVETFLQRPTREDLAWAIRQSRAHDSRPSYRRPDTLGWRTWSWSRVDKCLVSHHSGVTWPTPEHKVPHWDESAVVRGHAGVHACRLPRGDWRFADKPNDMPLGLVLGLVERFGKFVLGTEGWRAEWVIIRELLAPNEVSAATLRQAYPELVVHVAHPNHWIRNMRFV